MKRLLLSSILSLMLTACGGTSEAVIIKNNDNNMGASVNEQPELKTEIGLDEHIAFERKYLPIVEKAIKDVFSDPTKFEAYGHYYIDDSNHDLTIVFLLNQPDERGVKELKKVLQAEMGDNVAFRTSKHSHKELTRVQEEITKALDEMTLKGGWSVSTDVRKQKVVIEAYVTEAQKSQLISRFGSEMVDVKTSGIVTAIIGYVVKQQEGKILVVSPKVQDFGATGGERYHYNASWYSNVPSNVKVGHKVEVKVIEGPTTLQYPGDSNAEEVIIIPSTKPQQATMTEDEAIRKALASDEYRQSEFAGYWMPVVKETKFDAEQLHWTVYFTNESTDKVLPIQIKN
jgi:hypothetical protein